MRSCCVQQAIWNLSVKAALGRVDLVAPVAKSRPLRRVESSLHERAVAAARTPAPSTAILRSPRHRAGKTDPAAR